MIEERDREVSHASRNYLDISVITLDETTDTIDTEGVNIENESVVEVMQELATSDDENYYGNASSSEDDNDHNVDFGYDFSRGVPPVHETIETIRQVHEDEEAIVNNTIDLTDSPLRHSQLLDIA